MTRSNESAPKARRGNLSKSEMLSVGWPQMGKAQRGLVPDPFVAGARTKRQRNQAAEETKVTKEFGIGITVCATYRV